LVVPSADPSPKFQLKEYGPVPLVTVAVKVTGLPTVGEALTVKLTVGATPATVTVWGVAVAVAAAESVTERVAEKEPFVA